MGHDTNKPITDFSLDNSFESVLARRLKRRDVLAGGISMASLPVLASLGLVGCGDDNPVFLPASPTLGFTAVAKSTADVVAVPSGYSVNTLWALGDSFALADPAWADNGSETAESYNRRAGDHHDALYFFGLSAAGSPDPTSNTRGILAMNHEAPNPFNTATGLSGNSATPTLPNHLYMHPAGATSVVTGGVATRTTATGIDEVRKEVNAHGVSLIEVSKTGSAWAVVKDSPFNRRVTGLTTMDITGPLRGNARMVTQFSVTGQQTQGTVNNCANGYTPWGTNLTCEENWVGYFARAAGDNAKRSDLLMNNVNDTASLARYGNAEGARQRLNWNTVNATDEFARWDTSVKGVSLSGIDDFRNAINQFGYVVEMDPYNPAAVPAKRTALGRFAHEGAWPAVVVAGKPLVWYMGDDNRGDYVYKFVSKKNWVAGDANRSDRMVVGGEYLDFGKLFVAKFNADGSGAWLLIADTDVASTVSAFLDTRLAADAAMATRMDRPEWAAVHPQTGEVYLTLTNNSNRGRSGNTPAVDAANPRNYDATTGDLATSQDGNVNGHIIRWREAGSDPAATTFVWDIYLFGARSTYPAAVNQSALDASNDFSSPDGLWFGRPGNPAEGILWIQTDDGAYTDTTNCMMLAAVAGKVGDGAPATIGSQATFKGANATAGNLRRFLVGPKQCEITGIDSTPDGKTLFVNIQHPGEDTAPTYSNPATFGSHWPDSQTNVASTKRPRSATIVITKNDGGVIGL